MDLKAFAGSRPRTAAMIALRDGPKNIGELAQATGLVDTAIFHAIKPIIAEGIIERDRGRYSLTHIGQIEARLIARMEGVLAVLEENPAFWRGHDLSSIPDFLQDRLGALRGAKCYQDDRDTTLNSQTAFLEAVERATEMYGISGIIAPGYAEMIIAALEKGTQVELILTRGVIENIPADALAVAQSYPNFRLYQIEEAKIGFTVTNELISLALYDLSGSYDPQMDLICGGARAVAWGRELWREYKGKAKVGK